MEGRSPLPCSGGSGLLSLRVSYFAPSEFRGVRGLRVLHVLCSLANSQEFAVCAWLHVQGISESVGSTSLRQRATTLLTRAHLS